jgi:ATP-binding cassette subfamily C protein
MLEIYDRVLPSRSVPTLVALSLIAGLLFAAQGALDLLRTRLLVRIGAALDESLNRRIYEVIVRLPLKTGNLTNGLEPVRDLDAVRSFLSSVGPTALFDLPWMPLYLVLIYAFHPLLGATALAGAIFLGLLTLLTETKTRGPIRAATEAAVNRNALADRSSRNAEVLTAMGMADRLYAKWSQLNGDFISSQQHASDVGGGFGAISKVVRMMLQSAMLGIGAYLVINQQATAGVIIAGAILTARALAPVDLAIAHWKGFVAARQSWQRLTKLLTLLPAQSVPLELPIPTKSLSVLGLSVTPPGESRVVLHDVTLTLHTGQGLGIIGPSAAGKSSLVRVLVGVWQPLRGSVRFDGAALDQWMPGALGNYIGYMPQDVELFGGTIAENIARFEPNAKAECIISAARAAGVHDLITSLSGGYETQVGERGGALSAGRRQRIALARALYTNPFLVVLDEPNSNLDADGEAALTEAIQAVRARGGIIVVVAHRPSALAGLDTVLVMNHGRIQAIGKKEDVLAKMLRPVAATLVEPQVAVPSIRAS